MVEKYIFHHVKCFYHSVHLLSDILGRRHGFDNFEFPVLIAKRRLICACANLRSAGVVDGHKVTRTQTDGARSVLYVSIYKAVVRMENQDLLLGETARLTIRRNSKAYY